MKFEDVEKAQLDYRSGVVKYLSIGGGISLLIIIPAVLSSSSLLIIFPILFFATIFIAIVTVFANRKKAEAYRSAYKAYFVEKALHETFTNLKYDHASGIPRDILSSTGMVNTGDKYSSNDLTTGKYKDVAFTQADVHIQVENTDSKGNTYYTTIFKGRFMIFEFPKKFNFRLEVVEKYFGANRVPGKNKQTGRKFEKIKVESSEFNKIFKTYAEDGFEAFYLLDPAFIHNILELDSQYNGKLLLGFYDNKLLVGLKDGKDAFEPPSIFKKLDETSETEKITKDIHLITNFVDKLKLDRKLFK